MVQHLYYFKAETSKTPGRDIFVFSIDTNKKKFVPLGMNTTRDYIIEGGSQSSCNKTQILACKRNCAALIMFDGWKIKDDYPW